MLDYVDLEVDIEVLVKIHCVEFWSTERRRNDTRRKHDDHRRHQ
jgi:hypothetical protein